MAAAGEKDCKRYFHMLQLKQNVVDKVIDQWQPRQHGTVRYIAA